ncbi:MAG: hypothetical protein C0475_02325 [Planctomyces sp.]|nr:hypothetical protein [Planctomyces sp.]MBA4038901.1 hypothetical protein [Planctomyces sp.]
MRDALGPGTVLGYCTNVHAGATLAGVLDALARVAPRLRTAGDAPVGVGLWLSARAAAELEHAPDGPARLRDRLAQLGLFTFTFNGFPYSDFHTPVVKHAVYEPTWADPRRADYTLALARLAAQLAEPGAAFSISTLPLGWRAAMSPDQRRAAAQRLARTADALARIEGDTGSRVTVDLEPEPGCVLDTAAGVAEFFAGDLAAAASAAGVPEPALRRHIGVCHDVCHSAVMHEDQAGAMAAYAAAGVRVGKLQVSAAIEGTLEQLGRFAEPRYLHQTVVRRPGGPPAFHEDLPAARAAHPPDAVARAHFHVPIFLSHFGAVRSTADQIAPAIAAARGLHGVRAFEVETYAWGVLPDGLRPDDPAEGIAAELRWARGQAP